MQMWRTRLPSRNSSPCQRTDGDGEITTRRDGILSPDAVARQIIHLRPLADRVGLLRSASSRSARQWGFVSTSASWRIPVVVGYAAARFRGMKRDAVPG